MSARSFHLTAASSLRRFATVVLSAGLIACGPLAEGELEDPSEGDGLYEEAKADSASSDLKAALTGSTLWVKRGLTRAARNGADAFVLAGRTSRNLTGGLGFICDDPYGAFTQLSARKFELVWMLTEARGLATGVNQFVRVDFVTKPQHLTGYLTVQPRLEAGSGSGASLDADLLPVLVRGRTVFRLTGTAPSKLYRVAIKAGATRLEEVAIVDDTHFRADLAVDQVLALAGTSSELVVEVGLLSGTQLKRARVGLQVKQLQLSVADPYQVWPEPTCTPAVKTCLGKLPAGTLDLASCGTSRQVQACRKELGVLVEGTMVQAAIAQADTRLAAPAGFAGDAPALVGSDQLATFKPAVRAALVSRLQDESGSWYLDATARETALKLAVDGVLDQVYATPLAYVAAHAPLASSATRRRQVAADGLLQYLAAQDLAATEYSNTLLHLTRAFRAKHLAALRELRETAQPLIGPGEYKYMTTWLSSPVEVNLSKTTGKVTSIYFEID